MKNLLFASLALSMVAFVGCNNAESETASDPGSDTTPAAEDSFKISAEALTVTAGTDEMLSVGVDRGDKFAEEVTVTIEGAKDGVTVEPTELTFKKEEDSKDVKVSVAEGTAGEQKVQLMLKGKGGEKEADVEVTITTEAAEGDDTDGDDTDGGDEN